MVLEIVFSVHVERIEGPEGDLASLCLVFTSASPLPSFPKLVEMGLHQTMCWQTGAKLECFSHQIPSLSDNKLQMHGF